MRDGSRNALTELVMVMTLMILFGFAVYSLICEGGKAESRIDGEKAAEIGARTANSYVRVRLHENDAAGRIAVEPNGLNGLDSVLIKNRAPEDPEDGYDVWIYWADGELREVLAGPGEIPAWEGANVIAKVDGFKVRMEESGKVSFSVEYTYNKKLLKLPDVLYLRSEGRRRSG